MKLLPAVLLLLLLPLAARAESPATQPQSRLTILTQLPLRGGTLAFSPDGKLLATAGPKVIELWDLATGKNLAAWATNTPETPCIAFSPDSKTFASTSTQDGTIKLYDLPTAQNTTTLRDRPSSVAAIAFSPDGKTLASGGGNETIRIWDLATGKIKTTLNTLSQPVRILTFTPDGRTLIVTGSPKGIMLWDVSTARQVGLLPLPDRGAAFYSKAKALCSPDGKTLVFGGPCMPALQFWDLASRKMTAEFTADIATGAATVFFAPDGKSLTWFAIDSDREWAVTVHDLPTGKKTAYQKIPAEFYRAAFSPDGQTLATVVGQTVYLWTIAPTPIPSNAPSRTP